MARDSDDRQGGRTRLPAHEQIYRRLRAMVLFGDLAPGEAVTIQGLSARLEAGMTPVREAIRRLIAAGALESLGNRRVCVPHPSAADIGDISIARQWLEAHLAHRATTRAGAGDLARLARLDGDLDGAIADGDLRGYLECNYRFHRAVYDLAEAPVLTALADGLWLRFGPSLRVVCGRLGTQNLPDQHKAMLQAMARGDAEAAAAAMREDVAQGMEQMRLALGNRRRAR
ncbi:MAG: GntR family transcriptional regulator AgkR [Roseovarius sp.]